MKVCGIELKGSDAILVCLQGNADSAKIILAKKKKFSLSDALNQKEVVLFSKSIKSFLEGEKFDKVAIKGRATKGRFAGGSVSFKMEGLIQLAEVDVEIVHSATVKAKLKQKNVVVENEEVLSYQKEALSLAKYLLT